jgi:hypothetical protein
MVEKGINQNRSPVLKREQGIKSTPRFTTHDLGKGLVHKLLKQAGLKGG